MGLLDLFKTKTAVALSAYDRGYEDFVTKASNPYPESSQEHDDWRAGFRAAADDWSW